MLPNFICIGTYRAGTTWLHWVLSQHPEVFVPAEKEIMFFSRYYDKGVDWYERFYEHASSEKITAGICPTYLSHPKAAERIFQHLPEVKLFVCLRDPAEQVYSHYKLGYSRGHYNQPFENIVRDDSFSALRHAFYGKHIKRYLKYFDRSQLLILTYDHIKRDPQDFLKILYNDLDISEFYPAELNKPVNYSRAPKSLTLDRLIATIGEMLRDMGLYKLKIFLNQVGVAEKLKALNSKKVKSQLLSPDTRKYLHAYYEEDRKLLESLTGLDLSSWSE